MKTTLSTLVLLFCLTAYSHAKTEASQIVAVRYVEGYQDKTVIGRRFAIFQREDKEKIRFRVYIPQGWSEDTDTNTHNILTLIKEFPVAIKKTPQDSAHDRIFKPEGTLIFHAPVDEPEKNIRNWKLKELKLSKEHNQTSEVNGEAKSASN